MNNSSKGRVLIIDSAQHESLNELVESLSQSQIEVILDKDLGTAIHRAQTERFDTIVVDSSVQGMPIEQTIQILKSIDSQTKIIVKTDINSKELEAKVRKEAIYYYHLCSFGIDDLKIAIESALRQQCEGSGYGAQASASEEPRKLIMMVDENDNFIEIHKTNLERHHFRVEVYFDADRAVEKIRKQKPNLLMVDINIPVGSAGLHFLEMLLSDEKMVSIPVLIFISRERMTMYKRILDLVKNKLPTWSYLEKPVKIEDVIPKVKKLLRQSEELIQTNI